MAGRPLEDLDLGGQGVLVLGLERAAGGYESAPQASAIVGADDTLILYGPTSVLRSRQLTA